MAVLKRLVRWLRWRVDTQERDYAAFVARLRCDRERAAWYLD